MTDATSLFNSVDAPAEDSVTALFNSTDMPEPTPADEPTMDTLAAARQARLAALGDTHLAKDNIDQLNTLTALYTDSIQRSGLNRLQTEAAISSKENEVASAVAAMRAAPTSDPTGELRNQASLMAQQVLMEDIQDRQEYALEQRTAARVRDLAASGDSTQAQILMNMMEHGSPVQMQQDYIAKQLILQREIDRARIEVENQGWFSHLADFLASGVLVWKGKDADVDIPKGVQNWYDSLFSGERIRNEASALYNMPAPEFARYVRENLIPQVRESTSFLGFHNRAQDLDLLTRFQSTPPTDQTNAMDAIGIASVLPFTEMTKIPSFLAGLGARRAGVSAIVEATEAIIKEGTEAAVKSTGIPEEVVIEGLSVSAINPQPSGIVSLGVDAGERLARGRALYEALTGEAVPNAGRLTEAEEKAAVQRVENAVREEFGREVKDVIPERIPMTGGSYINRVTFLLGRKNGGGFASERSAQIWAGRDSVRLTDFETIRDASGQWFLKVTRNVSEEGFATTPLNPGATTFWARRLLGSHLAGDDILNEVAQVAGDRKAAAVNRIMKPMQAVFRRLRPQERMNVDDMLTYQERQGRWLSENEAEAIWRRSFKREMGDRERDALRAAQELNDIEYAIRNDDLYKNLVVSGHSQIEFDTGIGPFSGPGRVLSELPKSFPNRVFDLTTREHILNVTPEVMERLRAEGYQFIRPTEAMELADGTTVGTFIGKPGSFVERNLDRLQIAYRAGGHRLYDPAKVTHFLRQAVWSIQSDTGKKFLRNPNTYRGGTRAEMEHIGQLLEQARQRYIQGNATAADIDAILGPRLGLPSGEDFLKGMEGYMHEDGIWRQDFVRDEPFVVTADRVMPEVYNTVDADVAAFANLEEGGFNGWLRTTGRLYYSRKGIALRDWMGAEAPILDSYETINRSLANVIQLSSFSDYKIESVNRWIQTFRKYIDVPANASSFREFLEGTVKPNIEPKIIQQLEAQREIIKRNLSWQTEIDHVGNQEARRFQDWLLGADPTSLQHTAAKTAIKWWSNNNPVQALRTIAFDMKLGLFNPGQFLLQTSTMAAAWSLSPKYATQGMLSGYFTKLFLAGSKVDFEQFAKMAGLSSAREAEAYLKTMKGSGFLDIGQHVAMDNFGPNAVTSAMGNAANDFIGRGRFFFNEAERWNRTVAYRIAWGEAVERFGAEAADGNDFQRFLARRRHDYSFNMSKASSAWWQNGVMSVPTQFWGYNARMMEAVFGNTFTRTQRASLAAGQLLFYGAAGTPITVVIQQLYQMFNGQQPLTESPTEKGAMGRFFNDGLIDTVMHGLTGQDISYGKRLGTGGWLVETIRSFFGISQYGPTSPAKFVAGASTNIAFNALGSIGKGLSDVYQYSRAEAGAEDNPVIGRALLSVADQISTVSNIHKALVLWNYGVYQSSSGLAMASDLPRPDAFAIALGFQPGELEQLNAMSDWNRNQSRIVDEAAQIINRYRARMVNEPDKRAEITNEINAYVRMLPPNIRTKALRKAHGSTDGSLYESLADRIERDRAAEQRIKERERLSGETN